MCSAGCKDFEIKLGQIPNSPDYVLLMCGNNRWFEPCFQEWDLADAAVACRYLGYSDFGIYTVTVTVKQLK